MEPVRRSGLRGDGRFPPTPTWFPPTPTRRRNKQWTAAGKARVPLMLVGLLDVLHAYPGQIPDLDAVLSVADYPCVPMCAPPQVSQGLASPEP